MATPEPVPAKEPAAAPSTSSKRPPRRRKAKQPKPAPEDTAADAAPAAPTAVETAAAVEPEPETAVPEPIEVEEPVVLSEDELKNPYIETVQKRVRNLQKRKLKLDKYEEQAATPDALKLNADQLLALKQKDQVIFPLKELDDLTKSFKIFDDEAKTSKLAAAHARKSEIASAVAQAKQAAKAEERERIRVLVKFLHAASWKRQFPSKDSSPAELSAFENLLALIYAGDEAAVDAVEKLAGGADELVAAGEEVATAENSLTFAQVKQLSLDQVDEVVDDETSAEQSKIETADVPAKEEEIVLPAAPALLTPTPPETIVVAATLPDDDEDENTPPAIKMIKVPVRRHEDIFLNESELEAEELLPAADDTETDAIPSLPPLQTATSAWAPLPQQNGIPPPAQTQIDDSHANTAAIVEWDEPVSEQQDAPLDWAASSPPPMTASVATPVAAAEPVWEKVGSSQSNSRFGARKPNAAPPFQQTTNGQQQQRNNRRPRGGFAGRGGGFMRGRGNGRSQNQRPQQQQRQIPAQ
ncbi:hypothetical protein BZA70DRAFT_69568 [Myxozyma melibiosi]|uniref:YAG7-like dimerisation domain-containing protein n=1 Tax=Myxozyma melibiosi TaxID=54550 RepID=A0ABR1F185_9ASCO